MIRFWLTNLVLLSLTGISVNALYANTCSSYFLKTSSEEVEYDFAYAVAIPENLIKNLDQLDRTIIDSYFYTPKLNKKELKSVEEYFNFLKSIRINNVVNSDRNTKEDQLAIEAVENTLIIHFLKVLTPLMLENYRPEYSMSKYVLGIRLKILEGLNLYRSQEDSKGLGLTYFLQDNISRDIKKIIFPKLDMDLTKLDLVFSNVFEELIGFDYLMNENLRSFQFLKRYYKPKLYK